MSYSKVTITFNEDLPIGARFHLETGGWINIDEKWVSVRQGSNQVTQGTPTATAGERSAINFVEAFNLDANTLLNFAVSRVSNIVTLLSNNLVTSFGNGAVNNATWDEYLGWVVDGGGSLVSYNVVFDIQNGTGTGFNINNIAYSEADTNKCETVKATITTNELATLITIPFITLKGYTANTDNPFTITINRGVTFTEYCKNANGDIAKKGMFVPRLVSSNVFINISNTPAGATVNINIQNIDILETTYLNDIATTNIVRKINVEYSLNSNAWQTSSNYTGLTEGNYSLRIKDEFGCVVTKTFVVDEFGIYKPYNYYSESNSLRLVECVDFSLNHRTDDNSLSYKAYAQNENLAYQEIQRYINKDNVTNQFRTNYRSISIKAVDLVNGLETTVPHQKKSNNIGLKDSRDAIKYDLSNGNTGIYFTAGNIYDFDTNADIGDYSLNGGLPIWAVKDNYIYFETAWYQIKDVFFDSDKNADVIQITNTYAGNDTTVVVKSIYNKEEFEVYEFSLNCLLFPNRDIRIEIKLTDTRFDDFNYVSEKISIRPSHEHTVEIQYWNSTNTDIDYSTGIKNLLRLQLTSRIGVTEEDSDTYKAEQTAVLLNSELFKVDEFVFEALTKGLWQKLLQALSHDNIFIDGVGYLKLSSPSSEHQGHTNKYIITVKMIKTNQSQNGTISSSGLSTLDIPNLLSKGVNGYIRY